MAFASGFTVTEPNEGRVTLELNWQDAEILTRIVGLTNSASLNEHSPALHNFVTSMVERIGRAHESRNYEARISIGQVYVDRVGDGTI